MSDNTKIEWTDATWNPVTGCSVVSPGCTNCYAMQLAGTRLKHHASRAGLTQDTKAGPVWNGKVRLNEQWLNQPLRWKRPRLIFVCAHGDLFHESVPEEWIDRVFAVMALCPQHTFQVLTKRSKRMRAYMDGDVAPSMTRVFNIVADTPGVASWTPWWPLPNVWLGVSAEDQKRADERIPDLLATPAAVRFVSAEPLLGPIRFDIIQAPYAPLELPFFNTLSGHRHGWLGGVIDGPDNTHCISEFPDTGKLDWIIVGGESGPGARPMHPDWARSIRDQCSAAGVEFHFKQWGEFMPFGIDETGAVDPPLNAASLTFKGMVRWEGHVARPIHPKEPISTAMAPGVLSMKVGKDRAGRLLDGVEHNGMPKVQP